MIYSVKIKTNTSNPNNPGIKYKNVIFEGVYHSEKKVKKEKVEKDIIQFFTENINPTMQGLLVSFKVLNIKTVKEDFVFEGGV